MNLTDREILELNELCGAVIDGTLTEAQRTRLSAWLGQSEAARRFYVSVLGQSASLHTYAAESHVEAPDISLSPVRLQKVFRFTVWWATVLPAAAALVLGLWFSYRPAAAVAAPARELVARFTGSKNAQWSSGAFQPGDRIGKNQRLELRAGLAEITFDSGARVVLEGPASLDITSAWDGQLRSGTLKASVPPEAIGFRISNPAVEVIDLGTEFTMIADGKGAADVLVLKGEVEAAPRAAIDQDTILLRENEARRFASSGISAVSDPERKFALFSEPLALDRFNPGIHYVHWSFDEEGGAVAQADARGRPAPAFDAQFVSADPAVTAARTTGHRAHALQFDGRFYAKAKFPGISSNSPRTVAFWVKVPEDAVTDAWMVSWGTTNQQLNNRPVQISWNRRPAEGALGALRTDFGGGHAIGTTSLRDGKWHHITVFFALADDPAAPVQVKQYVDGRLESSTISLDAVRARPGTGDGSMLDTVFLGCRLTAGRKQPERFRGEIDELFIADRGLQPTEIVSLMNDNRLPAASLAVTP
jgi:hypothetical protein